MLELTIRLIVSLAIVVGLLMLLARFGSRKFRGANGAMVQVVHRQPLSRTSAVAVVTVGTRVLVLGTTEQQVSVLAELDPDEIDVEDADLLLDTSLVEARAEEGGLRPSRSEGALAPVSKPTLVLAPPVLDVEPLEAPALRLDTLDVPARTPKRAPGSHRATPAPRAMPAAGTGPLAGSVLSPQTWRQAFAAASGRSTKGAARRAS